MKKLVKITALVFALLIVFAFAAPFLFKGKIISLIKNEANKNLNASVDFSDVDLSLFRHFPRLAVDVNDLKITGVDEFSRDTLISAKRIDIALNLMSIISGNDMKIYRISVEGPRIHAIVHKNGRANWSITKTDSAKTENNTADKPFRLELQKYSIENAYISYSDESSNMNAEIFNLSHEGSGNFNADLFTLKTGTNADAISFTYGGIPYLLRARTSIHTDIEIDNKNNKYSFNTDQITLNDLKLSVKGFFQMMQGDAYNMDISFNAPSTDFRNILSMIPAVYAKDFASIKTNGQALFKGFVKGIYDSKHMPAYHVNLDIKNGFFQYPDLPKAVKNINVSMQVDNPDGITDHTVVNISDGHIEMENDPFDFHLLLKKPVSDMYIDASLNGKIDLGSLSKFLKFETGTKMSGLVNAQLQARGSIAPLEKKQYDQFDASGTLTIDDFAYQSKSYPDGIALNKMVMNFNPKNVTLSELTGEYLKTNFSANGELNNFLAYALKNQPLEGSLNIRADQINLNDWMGISRDTNTRSTSAAATTAFVVPPNINFTINASADKVHYDKLDMQHVSGSLAIADETIRLNDVKADALDGTMAINGYYSTKENKKNPDIALNYDVKGLDIQKTFYAFNTVQKLMPVGKFIDGKLTSKMSMKGKLNEQMMPDLNTLSGDGNLLLLEGVLKKFEPLDQLAQTLKADQLKDIAIKDIKTNFSFKNGRVIVNPFSTKIKDITMEVGGSHGFDQTLDYAINLKIPRSELGGQANALVNNVVTKVNNKGIPVKVSDIISLNVKMGGTLTNPVINTDLKDAMSSTAGNLKQQASDFVKAQVDSAKQQVRDTAAAIKKQLVKSATDELKKQLTGQKDTNALVQTNSLDDSKKKVEETGKGLINSLLNKKKKE
ncbi:MAG TPA: AsmA-like C-terminal region-containing protein [Puia sp.]|nr:AsmA-like C-terminal region-containing protein [Puia sp.]